MIKNKLNYNLNQEWGCLEFKNGAVDIEPKTLYKFFHQESSSMIFYNSLSMVMLSMLTGGLIGLVFILYFTSDNKDMEYK